jgi:hypothetical protein
VADTDLRDRIARALCSSLPELCAPHQRAADTAMAVVQPELDRLEALEAAAPDWARHPEAVVQRVPIGTLARKIAEKRDALAKLNEACREVDRLHAVLAEVLRTFVQKTHPGRPCLQSLHVDVTTVERWRDALHPHPGGSDGS